jgi:preprotein translocase subunit YajC
MQWFISDAFAQAGGAPQGGGLISLLPLVAIFVVFYFLLIRPQQKRAKQHREMVAALKKGDEIVTGGGILGKITDSDDNFVTVEIASGVSVKVQRQSVGQMMVKGTAKSG